MNTKLQALVNKEDVVVSSSFDRVLSDKGHEFGTLKAVNDEKIQDAPKKAKVFFKNIGLFFAAPFVALAYVIALPFVGFYMFSKLAIEAKTKSGLTNY